MNVLDRAHVQSAGRLNGHEQWGVLVQLAGDDGLLLVSARHAAHDGEGPLAAAHVELLDQPVGVGAHLVLSDKAALLELRLPVALQHQVFLQRVVQNQTVLVPVLGDVAHAGLAALTDGRVGNFLSAEADAARAHRLKAGQSRHELGLPVALDARQAHDLARAHLKRHVLDRVGGVHAAPDRHVLHIQDDFTGRAILLLDLQADRTAHHHAGEFLLGGVLDVHGADALALAKHGAAVGHGHDLGQLVGDEEDGLALLGEASHDFHQLVDFLRGEHGGRLVQDEDFVVAVEHLEDLHALLHADRYIFNQGIGINAHPIPIAQFQNLFAGVLLLKKAQSGVLCAEDDVVQHGEDVHQLEVLMHHSDVQRVCVVGIVDVDDLAVLLDGSLIRLIQAEQHAHQRGLARAVFSQQGVNFALFELKRHVVVGLNSREFFGDVQHLDYVFAHKTSPRCQSVARFRRRGAEARSPAPCGQDDQF